MDYPVFETLLGIFAFGLVITGIVINGILRAKEFAERNEAVERANNIEADRQPLESDVTARRGVAQKVPAN